nr:hypothetical protein [Tanacetum cinerariifolium]
SAIPEKSHGIKNLPGSPNFSGVFAGSEVETGGAFSTTRGDFEGPSYATPLRVVIAFKLLFGLAIVLLGRVPELEGDAVFICRRLAIMFLISLVWLDRDV